MTISVVKEQVRKFLARTEAEVLVIRGAWGTGKTFLWDSLLKEAVADKKVARSKYAYISLFGIESLEKVKAGVFQNTIGTSQVGKPPSLETLKENTEGFFGSLGRKLTKAADYIPGAEDYSALISGAMYMTVKDTIICIDDFERKSDDLGSREVLGFALQLKEQRNCKLVLIFNDSELTELAKAEYEKLREKVVDLEIEFRPTPREAAEIALSLPSPQRDDISVLIQKLGISNIRIIKKIERIARDMAPHLEGLEPELIHQVNHSLCLFGYAFYARTADVPSCEYIRSVGFRLMGLSEEKELSETEKRWDGMLREYGFQHADNLDLLVCDAVTRGYFSTGEFEKLLGAENTKIKSAKSTQSYSKAWGVYHNSFENNESTVVAELNASFRANVKNISVVNLNGTVTLFRELSRSVEADELIELYISAHAGEDETFDLKKNSFTGDITDQRIITRFGEELRRKVKIEPFRDIVLRVAKKDSWTNEDISALAVASVDEYFNLFKSENGEDLSVIVNGCLRFGRFANPSNELKSIYSNTVEALKRIAAESRLNRLRVRKYGISLKDAL